MKPIRLLAIIEANTITGPAKTLLQFAQSVRQPRNQSSLEVMIATFHRKGDSTLFAETVREATLPFYSMTERGRFDFAVLSQLTALVRDVKPDLIQSHSVKSHFLVRLAGLKRFAPWIAFHHGYTWPDARMRLYNQLDRWSLRAAERVMTVSLPFRQELIHHGVKPDRIEVIHNSIDPNWASGNHTPQKAAELRASLKIGGDKKIILSVGRLSNEKDPLTLIRAFHRLQTLLNDRSSTHLLIVGDGPNRADLDNVVQELGLTQAVTFVGHVPSAAPYYGIADIFTLSSLSEGSPNALLEAMAAKVPVVATSVGGVPEIITHQESGLLVKPKDEEGMAAATATLLTHKDLATKLATMAYEKVLIRHSPDTYRRRLEQVYETLAGQR